MAALDELGSVVHSEAFVAMPFTGSATEVDSSPVAEHFKSSAAVRRVAVPHGQAPMARAQDVARRLGELQARVRAFRGEAAEGSGAVELCTKLTELVAVRFQSLHVRARAHPSRAERRGRPCRSARRRSLPTSRATCSRSTATCASCWAQW
jgi:hypothetical protein